jgi:hypothetical protein
MIAIAARREASRAAPTDFGDRGQVSKLSPPGNNGARAVQRDAPYERRSRTPAWSTNRLREKALSAASASLSRASTKPKEQGNTERGETAPPRRAGSSRQAGRPAAGKANLRDAGRSWSAADDDGFPAREEREQTEDDRARGPDEQDAGGCAFVATVL